MTTEASATSELRRRCGLPVTACVTALKKARWNPDRALAALIHSGAVPEEQLEPTWVPEEFFLQARLRKVRERIAEGARVKDFVPASSDTAKLLRRERDQLRQEPKALLAGEVTGLRQARLVAQMSAVRRNTRMRAYREAERESRRKLPAILRVVPFPPLRVVDETWTGRKALTSWANSYRNRSGTVAVEIAPPEQVEGTFAAAEYPPAPAQQAAYRFLNEHERDVTAAILEALFAEYPRLRKRYRADEQTPGNGHIGPFSMPAVESPAALKRLVSPNTVRVLTYARRGVAYVGFGMTCTWDREHGLGVLTHKSRVIKIGHVDVATDGWATKKDGGKPLIRKTRYAQ